MVRQHAGETDPQKIIDAIRASLDEAETAIKDPARRDDALRTVSSRLEEGGVSLRKFVASGRALR